MVNVEACVGSAYYGDKVKADVTVKVLELDIMVGSLSQMGYFPIVNSRFRVGKYAVSARLHLHNHQCVTVHGDNVKVAVAALPVALHNLKPFLLQKRYTKVFPPGTQFVVFCHRVVLLQR